MIERLLRLSLAHRWLVLGAAVAMMALGLLRAARMPLDVFPDLTAPRVSVVTEATGLAPEELERLVTFPIEAAVNGVPGVRRVRSASAPGISVVWVEFDWDTSASEARQRVTERLQGVSGQLPAEASAPLLAPPSSVMGEIAFVALSLAEPDASDAPGEPDAPDAKDAKNPAKQPQSAEIGQMELRRVAEIEVRRRLLAVAGVSQVVPLGGLERQYQILLDALLLERYQLTIEEVIAAVERGNQSAPGGFLVEGGQESMVRILGRAHGTDDLAAMVVAMRGGTAVRVGQLGQVREGPAMPRGSAGYNAEPAVILSVVKQPGADTLETTARVDAALDELAPGLAQRGIALHRDLFRQADFIQTSIDNLFVVLRDGAVLVTVVLLLFLWSLRPTLISALAIPLSLVAAVLVLDALGMTLDTMTLGGLAIAIGELVDDAIVDVENVARRLRERALVPEAERPPVIRTVFEASREIRSSIVSATLVIMLVFLPLFFLEGLEGRLMRPLAVAYLAAIGASLLVAVTVTPVLCSFLLPRAAERHARQEPPLLGRLHALYEPVLALALRRSGITAACAVLVIVAGMAGLAGVGRTFLPEFNEGSFTIAAVTLPGTPLEDSEALGAMAERILLADPAVVSTGRRTGRAEQDEHVQGVEASEIDVRLRPDARTKDEIVADIRSRLAAVPGMQFTIGQPISHRIDHMISGQRAALAIKVVGEDLEELRRVAERVRQAAESVPGLVDLNVEQVASIPQVVVAVDRARAAHYGLSAGEAATAVGTALWGRVAGHIIEHGAATEVLIRYADGVREDLEAVRRTRIPTPAGALVPVSAIADVRRDTGPNYILRENVERRVVVTGNVAGRDLRGVYEDMRARIDTAVELPAGIRIEYGGQFERAEAAGTRLLLLGGIAVLGIALIVGTTLGSVRRTLIILINLPLALAGGVIGVYLGGGALSVASMIGFITLFGIAMRNGILLATRVSDLERGGMELQLAVAQSARERLAPILMTAVTAALGVLPLALALGQPGSEIQAPMALVILTGMATSTALNMLVVPALLARWG